MRRIVNVTWVAAILVLGGCKKTADPPGRPAKNGPSTQGAMAKAGPGVNATGRAKPARVTQVWSVGGLQVPESVKHDPAKQVLYVSCINGKSTEKNGLGFIAKLSPQGKVLTLKWATGLDAPKGMGLRGDILYVTDVTRLHAIDTRTGKILRTVTAPETKFLNDIAVGPAGEVYVSDMVTGKIHVLRGGKLATLVDLKKFKGANGMLMRGAELLVGTATGIVQVTPGTGAAKMLVPVTGFGMIDGLRAYDPHAYIVSNWKGKTQIVSESGRVTVLLDTSPKNIQSADLEYIASKRLLLIPTFFDNRVVAYRID